MGLSPDKGWVRVQGAVSSEVLVGVLGGSGWFRVWHGFPRVPFFFWLKVDRVLMLRIRPGFIYLCKVH